MNSFIQQCSKELAQRHPDGKDYCIVIPSKRAKKYFMESLAQAYQKPVFLPKIQTMEEFVNSNTPGAKIDKTRQLFSLFQIVRKNAKYSEITFEEFMTWGPMLLDDFDEINRYLLNPDEVFKNLLSIKELESWNLDGPNELSEQQQRFLGFWNELPEFYHRFTALINAEEKATQGLALKFLATETQDQISTNDFHYFIGFNALSKGELMIIKKLINRNQATLWFDADRYYYDNIIHEAGMFLRKNLSFLQIKESPFIQNTLSSKAIDIQIVACAQVTGQVKLAATELAKKSQEELNNTVVLLADEALIVPLMKNIPESVETANITIGLPLKQTALKSLIDLVFTIQENKRRFKTDSAYYKDLMALYQHPLISSWLDLSSQNAINIWEKNTIQFNRVFQSIKEQNFNPDLNEITQILFHPWSKDYLLAIDQFKKLCKVLLIKLKDGFDLEKQQVLSFEEALITLDALAKEGLPDMELSTFKMFFNQHWTKKSIAFHGNPTKGLQIMGLLESRMLNFKHVIVLGMNEGNLPATNPIESIIPMDLRSALGLPTAREKQGLFAHHFYRLLHQAETVMISYSLSSEALNSSEPSRYITQLEMELARTNPNCKINKGYYYTSLPELSDFDSAIVAKGSQINVLLENYFKKHISASAIAKYLNCPLDFYYRYLAEFGEEETVEEELEMSSMGKIIHDTLETLYTPFAEIDKLGNKVIPAPQAILVRDVENMKKEAPRILKERFLAYIDNDPKLMASGKNWLTHQVALEFVFNMLTNDIAYIEAAQAPVFIHRLEARLLASMPIEIKGDTKTINWVGYIDRIDRIGNQYRIVDYKSGKVSDDDVIYKGKETIVDSFKGCKHALQLAVYAYLFEANYNFSPEVLGIYAIQRKNNAFFPLKLVDKTPDAFIQEFQALMSSVVEEIFDPSEAFRHNAKAKYCNYC
jgi:ATP-dependent helicase/nuclease subunit B